MRKFIDRVSASDVALFTSAVLFNGAAATYFITITLLWCGVIDHDQFLYVFHVAAFLAAAASIISIVSGRERIQLARAVASIRKGRRS